MDCLHFCQEMEHGHGSRLLSRSQAAVDAAFSLAEISKRREKLFEPAILAALGKGKSPGADQATHENEEEKESVTEPALTRLRTKLNDGSRNFVRGRSSLNSRNQNPAMACAGTCSSSAGIQRIRGVQLFPPFFRKMRKFPDHKRI